MYVAIVADPQVDRLLAPADDAIKLALQIEHQLVDKAQLHVAEGRVTDTQQVGLQLIARRIQRILQLAQGARVSDSSISQLEIAARQSLLSSAAMSFFTLCCCSSITRWVMSMLSKISATEYFNGANVAVPMEIVAALVGGVGGARVPAPRSTAASTDAAWRIRVGEYSNR